MLQYSLRQSQSVPSIFQKGTSPVLDYICNIGPNSARMPRSMHAHADLVEILLVCQGAGIYTIDGKRYAAQKGDLILYNQNAVHDEFGGTGETLHTYCIAVRNLHLRELAPGIIIAPHYAPIVSTGEKFTLFLRIFQAIEKEAKNSSPLSCEIANHIASILLLKAIQLIRTSARPCPKQFSPLMLAGIRFIDCHYRENIRLQDIAASIPMNAFYLAHIFKNELGISPMRYVTLRRIGEAQNLLIHTTMTITQIAAEVGYSNSNYFQNAFRNIIHVTPGAYRRLWVE